jgi:plastocyanin
MRSQLVVKAALVGLAAQVMAGGVAPGLASAQLRQSTTHTIALTVLEVKGSTTIDKLAPPAVSPADLSKAYGYKAPGQADHGTPAKWEVSSYLFAPSVVTIRRGDTVRLTVFVVNGDEHEVSVAGPDGQRIMGSAKWNRGHEYHLEFVATTPGTYQLICSTHAPTMAATFIALAD